MKVLHPRAPTANCTHTQTHTQKYTYVCFRQDIEGRGEKLERNTKWMAKRIRPLYKLIKSNATFANKFRMLETSNVEKPTHTHPHTHTHNTQKKYKGRPNLVKNHKILMWNVCVYLFVCACMSVHIMCVHVWVVFDNLISNIYLMHKQIKNMRFASLYENAIYYIHTYVCMYIFQCTSFINGNKLATQ